MANNPILLSAWNNTSKYFDTRKTQEKGKVSNRTRRNHFSLMFLSKKAYPQKDITTIRNRSPVIISSAP